MVRPCPICKRPVPPEELEGPNRPFCSARCKTIDLGSWLDEAYRIGQPVAEEDLDEGVPREGGSALESDAPKRKPS
jgi:endogenous inhibitor of DNA gyrase (YacG/DUF329 family)